MEGLGYTRTRGPTFTIDAADLRNGLGGLSLNDFQNAISNSQDPMAEFSTRMAEMTSEQQVGLLREGKELLDAGKLDEARDFFWAKLKKVVGKGVRVPSIGGIDSETDGDAVRSFLYSSLRPAEMAQSMACCNGMAEYYTAKGDLDSALSWYEEVNVLYQNTWFSPSVPTPSHDWMDFSIDVPDLSYQRAVSLSKSADLFEKLGNTATSVERLCALKDMMKLLPARHQTDALKQLFDIPKFFSQIQLRHPDPKLCHKLSVTHPRLQIQGSWKKIATQSGKKGPGARQRFSSFIWDSKLYVFGGWMGEMNLVAFKDFWCLDLTEQNEENRVWKKLPDYPTPISAAISFSFVVQREEKRAYLISGRQKVDYFDLAAEQWGSIRTTYKATAEDRAHGVKGNWPFPGQELQDAVVVIHEKKIYTFGGKHRNIVLGCNLLMELDLETNIWKRLSGYAVPQDVNDYSMPGPRLSACGWLGPCKDKIYVFLGVADRSGAEIMGQKHGASRSYGYHDFWSWSISHKRWGRERVSGNPPLSRAEMGFTFNEKLNKVVVFGGHAPSLPTTFVQQRKQDSFEFTYYADTFVYDYPEPDAIDTNFPPYASTNPEELTAPSQATYPAWKQVVTHGFPTYRCHSHLESDPDTGKVYLFGGYTNSDFVPSRGNYLTRPFGDVWQLRMDVPGEGGDFASVDMDTEARTARAGPWKRCFSCGNTGLWKQCAGACGGKAFFCGVDCQKDGWKDHKSLHSCKKA